MPQEPKGSDKLARTVAGVKSRRTKRQGHRGKNKGTPKVKTHVSIDAHVYIIGRHLGNVSALLNAAACHFIQHRHFEEFIKEWKVTAHKVEERGAVIPDPGEWDPEKAPSRKRKKLLEEDD
jgi:hypothetical protein